MSLPWKTVDTTLAYADHNLSQDDDKYFLVPSNISNTAVPHTHTTHTLYTHHSTHMQGMYIMFHYLKGTPYVTGDQGDARRLTNWEQIDHGEQYTATRKFLIAVPIVL